MLLTNCQQVAQALEEPLERISVAMVLRALYHYSQAVQRGAYDDRPLLLTAHAKLLGIVQRQRKQHRERQHLAIPGLRMIMCHHRPEAAQRSGWHPDTQLRQIAFEKGLKKVETPPYTRRFRGGKKRCRKAATAPQLEHRAGIDFIESKATKLIILYTPRQGLRGLLE